MPHFVTDISPVQRARAARRAHTVLDRSDRAARAYRLRLAALRDHAPDTLFARVRRVLREADVGPTRSE